MQEHNNASQTSSNLKNTKRTRFTLSIWEVLHLFTRGYYTHMRAYGHRKPPDNDSTICFSLLLKSTLYYSEDIQHRWWRWQQTLESYTPGHSRLLCTWHLLLLIEYPRLWARYTATYWGFLCRDVVRTLASIRLKCHDFQFRCPAQHACACGWTPHKGVVTWRSFFERFPHLDIVRILPADNVLVNRCVLAGDIHCPFPRAQGADDSNYQSDGDGRLPTAPVYHTNVE